MGIKIDELIGKMAKVQIQGMNVTKKEGKTIYVLNLEDENQNRYNVGLFGTEVAEAVLDKHGEKDEGKLYLNIPAEKLQKEGIAWINGVY